MAENGVKNNADQKGCYLPRPKPKRSAQFFTSYEN